jgi:predicted flap endonuclease-1-like 5' DNA nuclease
MLAEPAPEGALPAEGVVELESGDVEAPPEELGGPPPDGPEAMPEETVMLPEELGGPPPDGPEAVPEETVMPPEGVEAPPEEPGELPPEVIEAPPGEAGELPPDPVGEPPREALPEDADPARPPTVEAVSSPDVREVPGLSPIYAFLLRSAGLKTVDDLASATPDAVVSALSAPGVQPVKPETAADWISAARAMRGS